VTCSGPRVSVVICAWTEQRWDLLAEGVRAVLDQASAGDHQVLLVVDHNPALLERARRSFSGVDVIANEERRGLSGGRNTGIRHALGDVVAFLDDDATPRAGWLARLVGPYDNAAVVGTGGAVLPRWEHPPPAWLAPELYWIVGCTYRGLPEQTAPVRNPIGANMSFRRVVFDRVGGFAHELARTAGAAMVSCDETELSIRVRQDRPGALIVHAPDAAVDHFVPRDRLTLSYLARRCWGEGFAKALVSRGVGRVDGLASERDYVRHTLPAAVLRGLGDTVRGDLGGSARAGAVVSALAITGAGYARGLAKTAREAP
jgi:glycosyltransferase involved in cell wall biosynthesis